MESRTGTNGMINHKKMHKLMEKIHIMCPAIDLLSHILLLNYINPTQVWELGAGRGSWCIGLNRFNKNNILFNLVEDFTWSSSGLASNYVSYDWPATSIDIIEFINDVDPSLNYKLYDKDVLAYKDKFTNLEFVRIDCDLKNPKETYDHILQNSLDNLVILLDDIRPNGALNRLFEVLKYIESGELKIVLASNETLVLAKQNFDTVKFYEFCCENDCSNNVTHRDDFNIFNLTADFVTFKGTV
jgi:hypothetical protein